MNYLEFFDNKGGKVYEPNLFIHGIQEDVTNATELGSYLGVANESNIFNFKINDKGVSCFIDSSFEFPRIFDNTTSQKITSIIYLGENNAEIRDSPSISPDTIIKMRNIASTSLFNIGDRTFFNSTPLNYCLIPKTTQIGSTLDNNSVFRRVRNNGNAVFSKAAETANAGSPDVDIQTLISKNWNIKYSQNDTKPSKPTISETTIGGTYAELNVSQPTHVNDLKYALVFVDGFFQNLREYTSGLFFVGGLTPETSHEIKIIITDEYFNISEPAKINVTTTTTPALFQNAVAYYKLGNDNIDLINAYNGLNVGTGITRDGEYVDFGTNGAYIEAPVQDDFSFVDTNGDNTDFVIKTEVIFNTLKSNNLYWLVSKRQTNAAGVQEWQLVHNANGFDFLFFDENNVVYRVSTNINAVINQEYILGATLKGNDLSIFLNGVIINTTTIPSGVKLFNGNSTVQLGNSSFFNNALDGNFTGKMKETTILKNKGWDAGEISDNYNNGLGTTI